MRYARRIPRREDGAKQLAATKRSENVPVAIAVAVAVARFNINTASIVCQRSSPTQCYCQEPIASFV